MKTHKDLEVWKKGIELVTFIYELTRKFPKEEIYGLTSQARRSAVSVPSNIAEGSARASRKELIQFLHISMGSLAELETQMIIARNLDYTNSEELRAFEDRMLSLVKLLSALIKTLKNSDK